MQELGNSQNRDTRLFQAVDLFFRQRKSVSDIGDIMKLSRQAIYPLLLEGFDRGLLTVNAPIDRDRSERIGKKYKFNPASITVVGATSNDMGDYVSAAAARQVIQLIRSIDRTDRPIGLGLGPGRATLDFSRHMGNFLANEPVLPKLNLFGIAAGCPTDKPEYASVSFFNLYPPDAVEGRFGLFAETLVRARELPEICQRPGVKESFAKRGEIDIVVTAMGDFEDPHDLLRTFLDQIEASVGGPIVKHRNEFVGNVQYRPYSATKPMVESGDDYRFVTLFELKDFVSLAAKKDHHVVLIARSCAICGRSRATALRPLLTNPLLKVWSELIIDVETANDLLRPPSSRKTEGSRTAD